MKCKYCGTEVPNDAQFCPNCGKDLSKLRRCVKCGEIIDNDATFCPHCGVEQPVYQEDKSHKWVWIIVTIIVVAAAGTAYFFYHGRNNTNPNIASADSTETSVTDTVADTNSDEAAPSSNGEYNDDDFNYIFNSDGTTNDGTYHLSGYGMDAGDTKNDIDMDITINGSNITAKVTGGDWIKSETYSGTIDPKKRTITLTYDPHDDLHLYQFDLEASDSEGRDWNGGYQSSAYLTVHLSFEKKH